MLAHMVALDLRLPQAVGLHRCTGSYTASRGQDRHLKDVGTDYDRITALPSFDIAIGTHQPTRGNSEKVLLQSLEITVAAHGTSRCY